jgi:uncharacterized protein (UPF0297 family)
LPTKSDNMKTTMNIDKDLLKNVRSVLKRAGFTSVNGLVIYLLTKFFEENKEK